MSLRRMVIMISYVLPRHDPAAEGAIVMKAPTKEHMKQFNKKF